MLSKLSILAAKVTIVASLAFAGTAFAASPQCDGAAAVGATCTEAALSTGLNNVINAIFFIAGTAAVIILIVGGVGYILSTGDATRITKAKNTILYAVIGLIVVIIARAIVSFVVSRVSV